MGNQGIKAGIPAGLLADVETQLGVTWQSDITDAQYANWIASGMAYINGKLGTPADYTEAGEPRTLLFEYVRYARDAGLDVFEQNYLNRLLAIQNERKVAQYAQQSGDALSPPC